MVVFFIKFSKGGQVLEYLKQILKSNKVEMDSLKEVTDIFSMLGNQQELKNIFKKID